LTNQKLTSDERDNLMTLINPFYTKIRCIFYWYSERNMEAFPY